LKLIENGRVENPPSEKTIIEMAKVLEADADELILLAKKVPEAIREVIVDDDLATAFLRKVPQMSPEQRLKVKKFMDEVLCVVVSSQMMKWIGLPSPYY
jgi:transcriptional regulator with XRE-family HTH domain